MENNLGTTYPIELLQKKKHTRGGESLRVCNLKKNHTDVALWINVEFKCSSTTQRQLL